MPKVKQRDWSPEYMEWLFTYWYNHGRPSATMFYGIIPRLGSPEYPNEFVSAHYAIPNSYILKGILETEFIPRANKLDLMARQQVDNTLVAEKVAMLKRHAETGVKMETMAMDYLEKHKDQLGVNNAVKLLVEGLRVERESSGIPATLERMSEMSEEKLLAEIQKIISEAPIEMLEAISPSLDEESVIDGESKDA